MGTVGKIVRKVGRAIDPTAVAKTTSAEDIIKKSGVSKGELLESAEKTQQGVGQRRQEIKDSLAAREKMTTPQMQAAQAITPSQVEAAQIQRTNQDIRLGEGGQDIREGQMRQLGRLEAQATGQAPSIAEMQGRRRLGDVLAAQMAAASSTGTPLAARQAAIQAGEAQQDTPLWRSH